MDLQGCSFSQPGWRIASVVGSWGEPAGVGCGAASLADGDTQHGPAQGAVHGNQMAFVGLPAQGLMGGGLIEGGFFVLGNRLAEASER